MCEYEEEQPVTEREWSIARSKIVKRQLHITETLDPQDQVRLIEYSLRRRLLDDITTAAMNYALQAGMDFETFEYELIESAVGIVNDLQCALVKGELGGAVWHPKNWNFWSHDERAGLKAIKEHKPYMDREALEQIATDYLELPYRAPMVERLLVDALIALELYAFGDEMVRRPDSAIERTFSRSPMHQRHVLISTFFEIIFLAAVFLLPAWFVGTQLTGVTSATVVNWVVGILVALFLLVAAFNLLLLPFRWWHQIKGRRNVKALIKAMIDTYSEMGSTGAMSTKRVREAVTKAADIGVIWPGPLYALLDDNISRIGRV